MIYALYHEIAPNLTTAQMHVDDWIIICLTIYIYDSRGQGLSLTAPYSVRLVGVVSAHG